MHPSLGKIRSRWARAARPLVLATLLLSPLPGSAPLFAQLPPPEPTRPEFVERPFGPTPPPTPIPSPKRVLEESKPIPRSWIITGIVVAVLTTLALLYFGYRAWRSSNLFDRQYRFPRGQGAAVRFGGNKCGGLMATVSFARRPAGTAQASSESKPKDA